MSNTFFSGRWKSYLILLIAVLFSIYGTYPSGDNNFVKISDNIYLNKFEVSNADYKKYCDFVKEKDGVEAYKNALPDTAVWGTEKTRVFKEFYFSYPAYGNFPVVGVTYENAQKYCEWLTSSYKGDKKLRFRLPSDKEWTLAANQGNDLKIYAWDSPNLKDKRDRYRCNFLSELNGKSKITSEVKSFAPNTNGIYNQCGNVAEMVSEKGIAKGGSYSDVADDVKIASVKTYENPSAEIGFRVLMEVVE